MKIWLKIVDTSFKIVLLLFERYGYNKKVTPKKLLQQFSRSYFISKLKEIVYEYFWNRCILSRQKYISPKLPNIEYFGALSSHNGMALVVTKASTH